jgi:hypothetical protein
MNNNVIKISYFFWNCFVFLILVLSGCSVTGKYYSKYDSKKNDSERYGTRMFNSIELNKDSTYTSSEWHYVYHDLKHYIYDKTGAWVVYGDTIIINDGRYLYSKRTLTNLKNGVKWKKRPLTFVKNK